MRLERFVETWGTVIVVQVASSFLSENELGLAVDKVEKFFYKVDKFYEPGNEVGIMYNDKDLNINWQLADDEIILSEKDKTLGSFADYAASL